MTRYHVWIGLLLVIVVSMGVGLATADDGPRTDAERAFDIKGTTLCPVCDGQNVLESNAAIATSIRATIDELVAAGNSDAEIRAALEADFPGTNAIPPRTGLASLVWVLPVAALVAGAAALVFGFRRWANVAAVRASAADRELVESVRGGS